MKKALSLLLVLAMILAVVPAVFASETNTLVMGDNELAFAKDEMEKSWTIEAAEAGMLKIEVTALSYYDEYEESVVDTPADYIDRMFWGSYGLSINGESQWSSTGYVDVEAGDEVTVTLYNYNYMDTELTLNVDYYVMPEGIRDNPKVLEDVGAYTVSLEEGNEGYYFNWTAEEDGTLNVAVSSEGGWMYCVNNYGAYIYGETHWSDDDPVVSSEDVAVKAGETVSIFVSTYDPSARSNPAGDVTVTLSFEPAGESGSNEDGEAVDSGYASADEDSKKVILYTPAADGTLTITVGDGTAAWVSDVMNFSNYSTTEKVTGTDEASYTVEVKAGVTYAVRIYGQGDPCAAISNIPYSIVFTAADSGEQGGIVSPTETVNTATDKEQLKVPVAVTGDGTITFSISGDPGYRFWLFNPNGEYLTNGITGKEAQTYTYEVSGITGEYYFLIESYSNWDVSDGTITYSVSFEESEVVVEKPAYVISDTVITEPGTYEIGMEYADVTIVDFAPLETGYYTITVEGDALIGNYGGTSAFIQQIGELGTSLEWVCTEAPEVETDTILDENYNYIEITRTNGGQSLMLGIVSDNTPVTVTIVKTADYVNVEIPLYTYENKAEVSQFELCDCYTLGDYVDVYGETHTAVLGTDGYYHLDSADGPVLLVDLNYAGIVLTDALYEGRGIMYAYTTDENGNQVKYDIADAVQEYEAAANGDGYYPMTEDLLFFYKVYAEQAGTWSFYLEEGYNEECAWMYVCRTAETNHEWSEPVTVEPTCTENGTKTSTCTCCGVVKTEIIEALGHSYENGVCTKCGAEEEVDVPATEGGSTGSEGDSDNSGPSATGDAMSIAGVIIAMMTSATGLVVTKKKFF